MPKGPKGEKRPADAVGAAVMVAKIATGEVDDELTDDGKNKAAVELGQRGGKARAEKLSKLLAPWSPWPTLSRWKRAYENSPEKPYPRSYH